MIVRSQRRRPQAAFLAAALLTLGIWGGQAATAYASTPGAIPLTSSQCPTDIEQGQVSGCVTELQDLLNLHGAKLTVDGNFGSATLSAVKSFQSSHGLSVDGIVGPASKAALDAAAAPPPLSLTSSSCSNDITQGELDGCVTELQELLNSHGASLVVDGNFGPATHAAVISFQSSHSLSPDGIVGPNTKAALTGGTSSVPTPIALTSSKCPQDITDGEKDGCVTELQELLNGHGASLTVDGNFGSGTLAAVKTFQSGHGLSVDGIVGPNTKAALNGEGGTVPTPIPLNSSSCPNDIEQGQVSGCVTQLQQLLNRYGATIAVDGNFGSNTLAAVENYQSSHGLSVDGVVGPDTKAALDGSAPPVNNPPPPSSGTLAAVVTYAKNIENGDAETGWRGGRIPYEWAGGHTGTPGPSPGNCAAAGGDQACWTATQHGTIGGNGGIGLDCSGFSRWVYDLAYGRDVLGAEGTTTQISEMTRVTNPVPGDLVFFGSSPTATEHVGIYIGNGQMINAFETGTYVQTNQVTAPSAALIGYYQYGSGSTNTGGESTNSDFAKTVLSDGSWPQSSNNVTTLTQWMSSEEPSSDWWHHNNPLNNGLGSGGGAGTGSYTSLTVAADYVAQNLQGGSGYASIRADLASSAPPATTATAIIDSPWSCGHYSGSTTCNSNTAQWGAAYHHGSVAIVAAPSADW